MDLPSRGLDGLRRTTDALERAGFEPMLVGGLATFAWGEPRTTRDFDVAVRLRGRDAVAVRQALQGLGAEPQGPFSTDFGARFILPFKDGVPVDVFLADDEGREFERSRRVHVGPVAFRVLSPEDLVLHKLRGARRFPEERGKDLADASGVLFKQWRTFDHRYADAACQAHGVCSDLAALRDEVRDARERMGLPV